MVDIKSPPPPESRNKFEDVARNWFEREPEMRATFSEIDNRWYFGEVREDGPQELMNLAQDIARRRGQGSLEEKKARGRLLSDLKNFLVEFPNKHDNICLEHAGNPVLRIINVTTLGPGGKHRVGESFTIEPFWWALATYCRQLDLEHPEAGTQPPPSRFPSPLDLSWQEVVITFVSTGAINIKARGHVHRFHYAEIGFKDGRTANEPNQSWTFLKVFAKYSGEFPKSQDTNEPIKIAKQIKPAVKKLRKRLNAIMGLSEDPFHPYYKNKNYVTKFTISDPEASPGVHGHGAGWDA